MTTSIDLILYGHPHVSEIRNRAVFDLKRDGRRLTGDVDLDVRLTVRNRRSIGAVTDAQQALAEVIIAAVQCRTIESRGAIRSIHYRRPVVDGLDTMTVSFRVAADRLLLI